MSCKPCTEKENTCCESGLFTDELLEAAHLVPVDSCHITTPTPRVCRPRTVITDLFYDTFEEYDVGQSENMSGGVGWADSWSFDDPEVGTLLVAYDDFSTYADSTDADGEVMDAGNGLGTLIVE